MMALGYSGMHQGTVMLWLLAFFVILNPNIQRFVQNKVVYIKRHLWLGRTWYMRLGDTGETASVMTIFTQKALFGITAILTARPYVYARAWKFCSWEMYYFTNLFVWFRGPFHNNDLARSCTAFVLICKVCQCEQREKLSHLQIIVCML